LTSRTGRLASAPRSTLPTMSPPWFSCPAIAARLVAWLFREVRDRAGKDRVPRRRKAVRAVSLGGTVAANISTGRKAPVC
jgi:hypothetical protein